MDHYVCDNCFQFTTDPEHVHITNRMRYNAAFGNFMKDPEQFCCKCYRAVQGDCDLTDKYEELPL